MATSAADRLPQVCATVSEWTHTVGLDPLLGTQIEDIAALDMGASPGANLNSDAKAVTIEFPSNFGDTINTNGSRIWMANKPAYLDHTWAAEYDSAAVLPAALLTADMIGASAAEIGGSPWQAPALHKLATTTEYDGTNNRINTILLQLQLGAAPVEHDQSLSIHQAPLLVLETPRTDYDIEDRIMRTTDVAMDIESGHLMNYPNYRVFQVDNWGTTSEQWNLLDSVREDSVEINYSKELVNWEKGRPKAVFHQAISMVEASLTFTTAQPSPALKALANHTTATRNATDRYVQVGHDAGTCITGTTTTAFVVECATLGGFTDRFVIPKGTMKRSGSGGGDYYEETYEVTALASGVNRDVAFMRVSDTPAFRQFIPILYKAAA